MHKHASANRFYRLVWSEVHACWVVVAESARGRGKRNSAVRAARRLGAALIGTALAGGALAGAPPAGTALPSGGQLVAGQAHIATQGNQMTVTQGSQQAIINWQRFDIGANAAVRFDQPSASAVALNRVVGTDPSQIYGKLSSNGTVFLVNPHGVLFGAGAQVDVGALTASSLNLADSDFLAGRYDFSGTGAGAVTNAGTINTAAGGYVALIAPSVTNSGTIAAPQGTVALAAGEQVSVDLRGDGIIGVRTTRGALQALARNSGAISADGGRVLLSAAAADALTRATVNNTGIVQARGIVAEGGSIRLVGDDVHTGALDVSSTAGKGGTIAAEGQAVFVDGTLNANGTQGGTIAVTATGALSAAATASAAGSTGTGGSIAYTAGTSLIENASSVTHADGGTDGGTTTLTAGTALASSGTHTARGGAGTGGRIDVAGQDISLFSTVLDAAGATQGGLVRVGGAFQGGTARADAPDTGRFVTRWGQTAAIGNAATVFINDSSRIDVGATGATGQGGTAIVWSQKETTQLGAVNAAGAAAGGAVEISSADALRYVNLDKLAVGTGGTLLLDPKNIVISSDATQWTYKALLGAGQPVNENLDPGDGFGFAVALSADGKQLAVGAPYDGGATAGAVANPTANAGAVRLYTFTNGDFAGATLKGTLGSGYTGAGNVNVALAADALFGASVALSGDGKVLAVGAPGTAGGNGAVYTYRYGTTGFGGGYTTASVAGSGGAAFGTSVALNADGGRLAIGAINAMAGNGTVGIYGNAGTPTLASTIAGQDPAGMFGTALAFNGTGDRLAVGAIGADGGRGKVVLINTINPTSPALLATLGNGATAGSNTRVPLLAGEYFGSALALSADGTRLAVGATATPAYGSSTLGPGAVRIFDFGNASFGTPKLSATVGQGYTFAPDGSTSSAAYDNFGFAVALNGAGDRLVVGAPYADGIGQANVATGNVYAFALQPATATGSMYYTDLGASAGTTLVSAGALSSLLTSGVSVTLQASNDLTLKAGSNVDAGYGTAALTLNAGRSIVLDSSIMVHGALTIVANQSKPTATTGPVNSERDAGTAVLTVNGDLRSYDTVDLTLDQAGSYKTNTASGAVTVNATVAGTGVRVRNLGTAAGNDVVLGTGGSLLGFGNATVEVATKGNGRFTNNSTVATGGGNYGLYATGGARFLVYSNAPDTTTENMASGYSKHYAQQYTGTTPGYAASGSWFLYSTVPTLTVTPASASKVYDGVAGGTLIYAASGYIDGDTAATALTGTLGVTGGSKNVGAYSIAQGTLASNTGYNVVFNANNAKLTITPRALTVSATGIDRVYNGLAAATVTYGSDAIAGDTLAFTGTAAFGDKHAGTGKAVGVTGIAVSGTDAGNYTLTGTSAATTASITPRVLTVSATGVGKVYDGLATATATLGDDRVAGDTLAVASTGASYADKNAGANKTITVAGLALSGADAANYTLAGTSATTQATIAARSLTATATGSDKVYDGTSAATVTLAGNGIAGDDLVLTAGSATYAGKNAGTQAIAVNGIALTGNDAVNYTLASTSAGTSGTITPRTLNAGATGGSKIYDGTAAATVTYNDDRIAGDVLAYAGSATYADRNAGAGKDITVTGVTLSGAAAGNYTLAQTTLQTTGSITPRTLTATVSTTNKVYDGQRSATVTLGDNRIGGDQLTLTTTGAEYSGRNAGTGKTVTANGLALTGTDAGNYTLASTTATGQGDITARALTVTATGVDKVYDGTLAANVSYADNRVAGDDIGYTASATFGDRNAGSGKTVTVNGIALTGTDAGNYTLSGTTATTSATITARTLTATATGDTKVYDGTTAGTATLGDDRIAGDLLTLAASGATSFTDKNAGANKALTVAGITLTGTDAGNYILASTTASGTGTITPKAVTVAVAGTNKVYDGGIAATVTYTGAGGLAGDSFGFTGTAAFGDRNAGTGKTVTVSGIALTGTDAGNYALASTSAGTTAAITPRALTVGVASTGKVYDGTAAATVTTTDNRVAGDTLAFTVGAASYGDRNAGAGKTITATGIALSGTDALNYTLSNSSATTQATIAPRALTVTGTGVSKVYDGTTTANVTFTDNRLAGDVLDVTVAGATYADKNVGASKPLTISGATLTGTDAANYTVDLTSNSGTGAITPRTLTITATGTNKVYDGNAAATVTYGDNRVGGDDVTFGGSANFADRNAGTGKTVTVTGMALGGTDGGNYVLSSSSATTQADITPRALVVTATGGTKVYDGLTAATATLADDRIAGDVFAVTGGAAAYGDKHAGTNKTVTVAGIALSGTDAGNYTLAATTASGTGTITQRDLTYTATGADKVYDGTTTATLNFADDRVAGDALTYAPVASFADKNAGTGKTVTMTDLALTGADAGNYRLTATTASGTAAITPRVLNVSAAGAGKVYDGTTSASVSLTDNRVAGDALTVTGGASFASKNAGMQQLVLSGVSVTGTDAANYTVSTSGGGSALISPLALAATAVAADKVYDGTAAASVTLSANALAGDQVLISGSGAFADRNAGTGKTVAVTGVTLSGADAGNYTLDPASLKASASITPRTLVTTVTAADKTYDGTVAAQYAVTDDRIAGDTLAVSGGTATFADRNAGNGKTVTVTGLALSGADAGNYRLAASGGTTTASIGQKDLTIVASDQAREAGAANPALGFTVTGLVEGDSVGAVAATTPADAQSAAGTYPITLTGADLPNYRITYVPGVLTVIGASTPLADAIGSVIRENLPFTPDVNGFGVPASPDSPLQLLATAGGSGGIGGINGIASYIASTNNGTGTDGAAPGQDEVTTSRLPGGTQVIARNGGIRTTQ